MNFNKTIVIATLCILGLASSAVGSSLDKAKMLRQHGLVSEAKKELIEVIFSKQNAKNKAEAYYILGTVAFEQDDISVALDTWNQLVIEFPKSDKAQLVKDRINQLSEIVGETSRTVVENAIAQSYLRHGAFWSEEKRDRKFIIDSSYISSVNVAVSWYDKVIQEFPKTEASRLAYEEKMLTFTGTMRALLKEKMNELDRYREWRTFDSIKARIEKELEDGFNKYMPQLVETFSMFEKDHPDASSLQAFRYQIAQRYWINRDLERTQMWLNLIIEKSGEQHTFYRDLAERRLSNLK